MLSKSLGAADTTSAAGCAAARRGTEPIVRTITILTHITTTIPGTGDITATTIIMVSAMVMVTITGIIEIKACRDADPGIAFPH